MGLYQSPKTRNHFYLFTNYNTNMPSRAARMIEVNTKDLKNIGAEDLLLAGRRPSALRVAQCVKTIDGVMFASRNWANGCCDFGEGSDDPLLKFDRWEDLIQGCKAVKRVLAAEKAGCLYTRTLTDLVYIDVLKTFVPKMLRYLRTYNTQEGRKKDLKNFFGISMLLRKSF